MAENPARGRKASLAAIQESHDELERRVQERTRELSQRETQLARELEDANCLQVISSQMIGHDDIRTLCNQIVEAAIRLTRADFGSLQWLKPDHDELELLAWKGFHPDSAAYWTRVAVDGASSCALSLREGARVTIEDTALFAASEDLKHYDLSGIRAVQSTPLISRTGACVGMLSTHWRTPHRPLDRELDMIDVLARQAADLLEHRFNEDALRRAHADLERRVNERTEELQVLLRRLVSAQDKERKRIARDIHDQLGQQLTALRLYLEAMDSTGPADRMPPDASQRIQRLCEELDRDIDFLVWSLRPAILDHLGLAAALNDLARGWSNRFGIPVEYQAMGVDDIQFPAETETNVYRIAQEALHNVRKHAQATRATLSFERHGDRAVLTIEDDGRGFNAANGSLPDSDGLGLVSIRERAALVNGDVEIQSAPGLGTTVLLQFPI